MKIYTILIVFLIILSVSAFAYINRDNNGFLSDDPLYNAYEDASGTVIYPDQDPNNFYPEDIVYIGGLHGGGIHPDFSSGLTDAANDFFITWNVDTNGGYELSGSQGAGGNYVTKSNTGNIAITNDYIDQGLYSSTSGNTPFQNPFIDAVQTIINGNNEIGIIELRNNSFEIRNQTRDLVYNFSFGAGEVAASKVEIINPFGDNADKAIFATNKNIYVVNLSRSNSFNIINIYYYFGSYALGKNISFGCLRPWNNDATCKFIGVGDDGRYILNYSVVANTASYEKTLNGYCDAGSNTKMDTYPQYYASYGGNHYVIYPTCKGGASIYALFIDDVGSNVDNSVKLVASDSAPLISSQSYMVKAGSSGSFPQYYVFSGETWDGTALNEYRQVWQYNFSNLLMNLTGGYSYAYNYSNILVANNKKSGTKDICIFAENSTSNTLYCWRPQIAYMTLGTANYTYAYPQMDLYSNSWILGDYSHNASELCAAGIQGVVCSIANGGYIYNASSYYKLATPYSDFGSSAISIDNDKPYIATYRALSDTTRGITAIYDPVNGLLGTNYDAAHKLAAGLLWNNSFSQYAINYSVINDVNKSQSGITYNVIYNSSGANFNGINSDINTTLILPNSQLSILARISAKDINGDQSVILSYDPVTGQNGSGIQILSGRMKFFTDIAYCGYISIPLVDTAYHDYALIWNGSYYFAYRDGTLLNSSACARLYAVDPVHLGSYNNIAGFFSGTLSSFDVYNRALNSSELNHTTPTVTANNGTCSINSDCASGYPYCIGGCCVSAYYAGLPGQNQCNQESDCAVHTPYDYCGFPLNSSWSIATCEGNSSASQDGFQNLSCYFRQQAYHDSITGDTCPSDLLSWISPENGVQCTPHEGGVCAPPANIGGCPTVCEGKPDTLCPGLPQEICFFPGQDLCYWYQNSCHTTSCDYFNDDPIGCSDAGCHFRTVDSPDCNGVNTTSNGYYYCPNSSMIYQTWNPVYSYGSLFDGNLYCPITGDYGTPSFHPCASGEECYNGTCAAVICTADSEVCSEGIYFNYPQSGGNVYKCNGAGNGWAPITACTANQICRENGQYSAVCINKNKYYCMSNGICSELYANNDSVPNTCYNTIAECQNQLNAGGGGGSNTGMLGDGSNAPMITFWNTILGGSSFAKMLFAMIMIIGALVAAYQMTHNVIMGLGAGMLMMILCTLFGLLPFYILAIFILGSVGLYILNGYITKSGSG